MLTPKGRGSLSDALFEGLRTRPSSWNSINQTLPDDDQDVQISLWGLYELHYHGFDDVDDDLEWEPAVISLRRSLERGFELELRERQPAGQLDASSVSTFIESFFDFVARHDGASVSSVVQKKATQEQVLELLRLRSIYHLKESDPTAWVVPRLPAVTKAALIELQYDEYGGGDPRRLHSEMFARGLEACGLRSEYGAYIDDVPLEVLEENNAMSLFGLNRRLRGAALGHLAAFEATSSVPSRRMTQGLDRVGLPQTMIDYYAEHIEADAVHEQLAVRTICGSLIEHDPHLVPDMLFGAFTCLDLEDRFAQRILREWAA